MSHSKIAMYSGVTRPTVIRRLSRLVKLGLVVRDGRGRYTLTQRAMRRLAG